MSFASSQVPITAGSGTNVATTTANSKEYQVVMPADVLGHVAGSRPVYFYNMPSQVHVNVANTVHWDIWNADGALKVRITSIRQLPNITTAVTGVAVDWQLMRTTAIGTGGSAQTAWLPDTTQTALSANITCRSKPTGGANASTVLLNYTISSEETNAATQLFAALAQGGVLNLVPAELHPPRSEHGILLGPSQGLRCVQVTNSNAGNTGWLIGFTVE